MRVLIVDDHLDQRELLSFLLQKQSNDWQIYNAANGKEALNVFAENNIDLIITDVKMPFIDGIELAETLRQQANLVPILFISGYDDFQYVKKALDLQVVNYLLKPINPEEFYQQLAKMIALSKEQKNNAKMKEHIVLQDSLMKLIQGHSIDQLAISEKEIILPILEGTKFLLALDVNPRESARFARHVTNGDGLQKLFLQTSLTRFIYLLNGPSKFEALRQKQQLLEELQPQLTEDYETELSEEIVASNDFYRVYQQLTNQINLNFYQKESRAADTKELPTASPEQEELVMKKLKQALQHRDYPRFANFLTEYLTRYQESASETPSIVKFFFANLYRMIIEVSKSDSIAARQPIKQILESERYHEILDIYDRLLTQLNEQSDALSSTTNNYVAETKTYILNHYPEELNLEILAKNVHLSPKYLSDLFKREETIGIIKYLNNVRMKKAEELLQDTHFRVNDISKKVGFNSYSYFIKQFQKKNGTTPERYRKLAQTKEDSYDKPL
ncbi:response regulator [Enterococcus sp. LJL90]